MYTHTLLHFVIHTYTLLFTYLYMHVHPAGSWPHRSKVQLWYYCGAVLSQKIPYLHRTHQQWDECQRKCWGKDTRYFVHACWFSWMVCAKQVNMLLQVQLPTFTHISSNCDSHSLPGMCKDGCSVGFVDVLKFAAVWKGGLDCFFTTKFLSGQVYTL